MSLLNSTSAFSSSCAASAAGFVLLARCAAFSASCAALYRFMQAIHDRLDRRHQVALLRLRVQFHRDHAIHLEVVVVAGGVELGAQVEDEVRVGRRRQFRRRRSRS